MVCNFKTFLFYDVTSRQNVNSKNGIRRRILEIVVRFFVHDLESYNPLFYNPPFTFITELLFVPWSINRKRGDLFNEDSKSFWVRYFLPFFWCNLENVFWTIEEKLAVSSNVYWIIKFLAGKSKVSEIFA